MSKLAVITRMSCAFLLVLIGLVVLPAAVQAKVNGGCTATGTASKSGAVGIVGGVVWGFGIGLLLQQMAILDPANVLGLLLPGGGAVLGAILPGLLHSRRTARP